MNYKDFTEKITYKQEQIKKLQEKIAECQQRIKKLTADIEKLQQKSIQEYMAHNNLTYEEFLGQLEKLKSLSDKGELSVNGECGAEQ